jgi:hypothetical protein
MTTGEADQVPPFSGDRRRLRWWCDIRWIAAGVVVGTIAFLLWGLFGPEPAIRVSRETTFLTEPLAADGLPDFHGAVLAMEGPAPPPEDNAAAELLQVLWPCGVDDADLPVVCRAMGIPDDPPSNRLRPPYEDASAQITRDAFDAGLERPWISPDLPVLAAWLIANEANINRLRVAVERPRYWFPSPSLLAKREGLLFGLILPELQDLRTASRSLRCRAMWHLGNGNHAEAWHDIRAIYRLARLLVAADRHSQCLVTRLVAVAIEATADEAVVHGLLASATLPPETLAEIRRDLDSLGRSGSVASAILMERLCFIDAVVGIVCRESGGREARVKSFGELSSAVNLDRMLLRTSIDWNDVLRSANKAYERLDAALLCPTFAERRAWFKREEAESAARLKSQAGAGSIFTFACSRGARSHYLGTRLSDLLMPSFSIASEAPVRSEVRFILMQTAAAIAAWRLDHIGDGSGYPEQLDELVPKYLPAVPIDVMYDKPLIYERRGEGYLLASVGPNGIYDGGTDMSGWIVKGEWQSEEQDVGYGECDLVVRMPVPERPFVKPSAP